MAENDEKSMACGSMLRRLAWMLFALTLLGETDADKAEQAMKAALPKFLHPNNPAGGE